MPDLLALMLSADDDGEHLAALLADPDGPTRLGFDPTPWDEPQHGLHGDVRRVAVAGEGLGLGACRMARGAL